MTDSAHVSVVTGASGGIGRWIALGLASAGHHVVLLCRDEARGRAVADWIAGRAPGCTSEVRLADLSLAREAARAGEAIAAAHPKLAVLVNNAGMFAARRRVTMEGHDEVLAVNHLAPYVLTDALEGALRAGTPSRIVNVGSDRSDRSRIDPADLELTRGWGMVRAYGRSKLAMMMTTFVRAERLRGSGVVANVVHPGAVATGLIKEGGAIGTAWRLMAPFMKTEEQGAATPLHVALSPVWATISGAYAKNCAAASPNHRARDLGLLEEVDAATRRLVMQATPVRPGG